jgi:hypothetical protein
VVYSIQDNDLGIKPKYQPVVKFQNIDENVLHTVQSGDSTATNKSEVDGGLERDNKEQEEVMDTDKDQSAQPIVFEIDPNVDINSSALKDMVSTDPIARESAQPSAQPRARDTSNKESDWNW